MQRDRQKQETKTKRPEQREGGREKYKEIEERESQRQG